MRDFLMDAVQLPEDHGDNDEDNEDDDDDDEEDDGAEGASAAAEVRLPGEKPRFGFSRKRL
jgi:hypothetical protein